MPLVSRRAGTGLIRLWQCARAPWKCAGWTRWCGPVRPLSRANRPHRTSGWWCRIPTGCPAVRSPGSNSWATLPMPGSSAVGPGLANRQKSTRRAHRTWHHALPVRAQPRPPHRFQGLRKARSYWARWPYGTWPEPQRTWPASPR